MQALLCQTCRYSDELRGGTCQWFIDTPLGRLDSHHRANLVNHYFPKASHQVILLSTDTEVDEAFYSQLSPQVSHAFEIIYNDQERAANLREGYFWRNKLRAVQ